MCSIIWITVKTKHRMHKIDRLLLYIYYLEVRCMKNILRKIRFATFNILHSSQLYVWTNFHIKWTIYPENLAETTNIQIVWLQIAAKCFFVFHFRSEMPSLQLSKRWNRKYLYLFNCPEWSWAYNFFVNSTWKHTTQPNWV